jgi:uncharacterized protein (DUF1501 family)
MNDPRSPEAPAPPRYLSPSRREVLRWLAYGSAGTALGGVLAACSSDPEVQRRPEGPFVRPAPKDLPHRRMLVVIELGGGNDALSTVVPYASDAYRRARPTLAVPEAEVIDLGDGLGINKRLAGMHERGLAIVEGVGTSNPDLSHFEMLDRWWNGSPHGLTSAERAALRPGFLGRLCDAVQGEERFTGISLKFGSAAGLRAARAATSGLPPVNQSFLQGQPNAAALSRFLTDLSRSGSGVSFPDARRGLGRMLWLTDLMDQLADPPTGYPDSDFGMQMAVASRLVRSGAGTRVLHIPMGASEYDTHSAHATRHPALLEELDAGLSAFVDDLRRHRLLDKVLIATTSEFGRRVAENSDGLDHGAASLMMLLGPVKAGLHGDPSPIDDLDELGNLRSTVSFDRYLATLAAWLEVDPADVLEGEGGRAPKAIDGLLAV